VWTLAGNHDIGLGNTNFDTVGKRFVENFGPLNMIVELKGVSFAIVNNLGK